jgi:diaminopimelate epimerase
MQCKPCNYSIISNHCSVINPIFVLGLKTMRIKFSKYQGAGNDFVMVDNRSKAYPLTQQQIERLCNRRFGIGADGLIVLENSMGVDFQMIYYNADGFVGSMCGNGGRCVVAFAKELGLITESCDFVAYDGLHSARCISNGDVALKMTDVANVTSVADAWQLDTGSPHLIFFKNNVKDIDVQVDGAAVRNSSLYKEQGINVNFAERIGDDLVLRTYERGVEDETLACGTGATATAIAAREAGLITEDKVLVNVLGGKLEVSFTKKENVYCDVYLTGDAKFVFKGELHV